MIEKGRHNSIDEWKSVTKESDIRQQKWFVSVSRKKKILDRKNSSNRKKKFHIQKSRSLEGQCKFPSRNSLFGEFFSWFCRRMKKCLACKFIEASLIFRTMTLWIRIEFEYKRFFYSILFSWKNRDIDCDTIIQFVIPIQYSIELSTKICIRQGPEKIKVCRMASRV